MKEKNIGESKLKDNLGEGFKIVLKDGAVKEQHLSQGSVTPSKLNDATVSQIQSMIDTAFADLQNQIVSIVRHDVAVSNEFGNDPLVSPYISVSQMALTNAFTAVWDKFDEITGEQSRGIVMTVTPDYFVSRTGCDVHITATTADNIGIFEHIAFYLNGDVVPFAKGDNVSTFEYDLHIDDAAAITCRAQIMGIHYTKSKYIRHYQEFWLGAEYAGNYQNVMVEENLISMEPSSHDVTVAEDGQHFFVIVGAGMTDFRRIDMNGFEIPMTKMPSGTLEGYDIYISDSEYVAGTYNIDVNG